MKDMSHQAAGLMLRDTEAPDRGCEKNLLDEASRDDSDPREDAEGCTLQGSIQALSLP